MVSKIKNDQMQIVIIYDKNNSHIEKNKRGHIKNPQMNIKYHVYHLWKIVIFDMILCHIRKFINF
jgi:hypothetical protein